MLDVFYGLPLPKIGSFEVLLANDELLMPVAFALAIVVGGHDEYTTVVPITTRADVGDQASYDVLIETGRNAECWARLPPRPGLWNEDALATFFLPTALPLAVLTNSKDARAAAMTEEAQALLRRRFSRAWLH